jgi:ribosomal protein S18 acetylase RimI-like enzyme
MKKVVLDRVHYGLAYRYRASTATTATVRLLLWATFFSFSVATMSGLWLPFHGTCSAFLRFLFTVQIAFQTMLRFCHVGNFLISTNDHADSSHPERFSKKSLAVAVHIRPIEPQDAEQVARIWRKGLDQTIDALCWGIFVVFRPLAEYLTDWAAQVALTKKGDIGPNGTNLLQRWSGSDERCMLVAVTSGELPSSLSSQSHQSQHHANYNETMILGCVGVKRGMGEHHTDPKSSWASIWRMSVDSNFRRCGLGTQLVEAAEDWARSKHCKAIILVTINPDAAKFYRQQGFRPARFRIFHYIKYLLIET